VVENKSGQPTMQRLLDREVDAAVMDGPAADAMAAASNGRLRRLLDPLAAERYALAMPPDRAALARQLDEALQGLRAEGALAALDQKHGIAR
jgi:ABC-type amino acid transport substrate-binding protein